MRVLSSFFLQNGVFTRNPFCLWWIQPLTFNKKTDNIRVRTKMISRIANRIGTNAVHNALLRDKVYEKLATWSGDSLPAVGVAIGRLIPSDDENLPFKLEYTTGVAGNRVDENALKQIFPDQFDKVDKTQFQALESDKFHLGSCGKAFTNLLIAELSEHDKSIHGDLTVGEVLPSVRNTWKDIRLVELLSHQAGLDDLLVLNKIDVKSLSGLGKYFKTAFKQTTKGTFATISDLWRPYHEEQALYSNLPSKDRIIKTRHERVLSMLDQHECDANPKLRGNWKYSNYGYAVASLLVELKTGKNFEELIRQHVFDPLGMNSAGFGNCQSPSYVDPSLPDEPQPDLPITQPWGHYNASSFSVKLVSHAQSELITVPDLLTPAGNMHASVEDWLRLLSSELILARTSPERLYFHKSFGAPLSKRKPNIGYGWGWIIEDHIQKLPPKTDAEPVSLVSKEPQHQYSLYHSGSDSLWFSTCKIDVEKGTVVALVTNASHLRSLLFLSQHLKELEALLLNQKI